MPEEERQSISRAELRAIVRVLADKEMAKPLHVVLDAQYIYKGITEWLPQWVSQGWLGASGPVGHRDLWEFIYETIRKLGHTPSFQWVPSHVGLEGNDGADALAEEGRGKHPNNYEYISKHRQQGGRGMWEDLGLVEMSSEEVESMEEGSSGSVSNQNSGTETDQQTE